MRTLLLALLMTTSYPAFASGTSFVQKSLKDIGGNLSGITYNPDRDSYFLILNNAGLIFEYNINFDRPVRTIRLLNMPNTDTEDIVYLGNNEYALVNEGNQVLIVPIDGTQTELDLNAGNREVQLMQLPPAGKRNKGLEGVCFSPAKNVLTAVQEKQPLRVYQWTRPSHRNNIHNPADLRLTEPFNPEKLAGATMKDLSACHYDDKTEHLFLLSHESSRLVKVNKDGRVTETRDLPMTVTQYEGLTLGKNQQLVLVSEPNIVVIFK